jgi:hypothetical protein
MRYFFLVIEGNFFFMPAEATGFPFAAMVAAILGFFVSLSFAMLFTMFVQTNLIVCTKHFS